MVRLKDCQLSAKEKEMLFQFPDGAITSKKEFWNKDHRDVIHEVYEFEVIYKS